MNDFIHLRSFSSCSMLESALRVSAMADYCLEYQMPAIALSDHNNMFAAVEFTQHLVPLGIQPILGLSLDIAIASEMDATDRDEPYQFCGSVALLAKNQHGYHNLIKLSSRYYLEGRKALNVAQLCQCHEGLILLTGGASGFLGRQLEASREVAGCQLKNLANSFEGRLYVELTRHQDLQDKKYEPMMLALAHQYQLPLAATNHCYYAHAENHLGYCILRAIGTGEAETLSRQEKRGEHYLKTPQEMKSLFADIPEAIANTVHIAKRCSFLLEAQKPILPSYHALGGKSEAELLIEMARQGLEQKLTEDVIPLHSKANHSALKKDYQQRLDYELDIIVEKGFAGYFLIVADFISWAKIQGIPVGPGRGSGAGSLVAWVLKITDLDPIRWGLLFERFLNPERTSMPDFDIDFCQDRRNEVIDYVRKIYGYERVAQIITFGSLKPRACVRDVGRVMGLPYGQVDRISKLIPDFTTHIAPLLSGKDAVPALVEMRNNQSQIKILLEMTGELEGLYRHASTHAAGLVIANQNLEEIVPLYHDGNEDNLPATQFNMKYVESTGLVKFDFLGLRTLSVIHAAVKMIAKEKQQQIDITHIPLDAKKVYQMLAAGDSFGVFQLESSGMRDVLKNMKPDRFEDLIAAVALYRPGPMENIPAYNARKNGKEKVRYLHPLLEPILCETYGIPVYQEQVMQMAEKLAGYTLGNADKLRRAMGKKIRKEMQAERAFFIEGAKAGHAIPKEKAEQIFDEMEAFAGYGFNKSHAAAYALVSYQTAWLKCFYPLEYYAAMLSYELHNTSKIAQYKVIIEQQGVEFLPPDLNHSESGFSFGSKPNSLRYALGALKNVGTDLVEAIITERKQGEAYQNIADFSERNCHLKLNRRMLETMAKAGVFDSLSEHRAQAFEAIDMILGHAAACLAQQNSTQNNLFFDSATAKPPAPALPQVAYWAHHEMLKNELDAIGFYISDHPLSPYRDHMARLGIIQASTISEHQGVISLAGIAGSIRRIRTKTGKRMAFVEFSDMSGQFEIAFFEEQLAEAQNLLEGQQPLLVKAEIHYFNNAQNEKKLRLRLKQIALLDLNLTQNIQKLELSFQKPDWLETIHEILARSAEQGAGMITLKFPVDSRIGERDISFDVTLGLKEKYNLSPGLVNALKALGGVEIEMR